VDDFSQTPGTGNFSFQRNAGCTDSTVNFCSVSATTSGNLSGMCASNTTGGSCSYRCVNNRWVSQNNTCIGPCSPGSATVVVQSVSGPARTDILLTGSSAPLYSSGTWTTTFQNQGTCSTTAVVTYLGSGGAGGIVDIMSDSCSGTVLAVSGTCTVQTRIKATANSSNFSTSIGMYWIY
jgi:hypothetical protein